MSELDVQIIEYLNAKFTEYSTVDFIETDPVQIPHMFSEKEDIEISGLLAATIAWGNRKMIIRNAKLLMTMLDNSPSDFIRNAGSSDLSHLKNFKHRTFNGEDLIAFIHSLKRIYTENGGLEKVFAEGYLQNNTVYSAINNFRKVFVQKDFPERAFKHVPNVERRSAAKRINMYIRWMVRTGIVDFGLWKKIPASSLMLPLDVHTGRVGRELGLLKRKQNDWKAVEEITGSLKSIDPNDPVKYDYALFGIGAFE